MKLAISNITWKAVFDDIMYKYLRYKGIALEVSPGRIFPWEENKVSGRMISPYERLEEAKDWYHIVNTHHKLEIASMKSLLYNVDNNMFANSTYRRFLLQYLKDSVDFADAINCPTLVFKCAENRLIPKDTNRKDAEKTAIEFFRELSDKAESKKICIALEAVAEDCGTNFINTTKEALEFVRKTDRPGFRVCVDIGNMISADEDPDEIFNNENMPYIEHVHISEPKLAPIRKRDIHIRTAELLKKLDYRKYVSVQMAEFPDVKLIQGALNYFNDLFVN